MKQNEHLHLNILIIDDEEEIRELVHDQLVDEGFTNISLAPNGQRALEIVQAKSIDLILSDHIMPELNGLDLYFKLKQQGDLPCFIMMTAKEREDLAPQPDKSLVLLQKPFDFNLLSDIIIEKCREILASRN